MVALQDELLKILLPHFEESQQEGQDERKYELSLEASVTQLKTKIAALEMEAGVDRLTLDNNNNNNKDDEEELSPVEVFLGDILVSFVDAAVSTDATSDLQESIDRVLALVAGLAVAYSAEVTSMVLTRAVEFSTVLLERVRGHACVLLGKLIASIKNSGQEEDDEDKETHLTQLLDTVLPRLQDKSQAVRCHAIKAVGSFFTTVEDIETYDEALEALLWNLAHDPSVSNRIVAVQVVPVHPNTLDCLTGRVRDVKAKVRAEALEVLRSKASVKDMNESQMVELIRSGLTNRCGVTKKAASKMICAGWMKSVSFDPIALLKLIGVMDNEAEASQVLQVITEIAHSSDSDLLDELSDPEIRAYRSGIESAAIPLKNSDDILEPEGLFFLRIRCKTVLDSKDYSSTQKESITSKLIPEIPVLCEVFESHAKALMDAIDESDENKQDNESFVCLQLLQLAELANLDEEGSRRHFAYVMKEMLSSVATPDDIVEGCINALRRVCDSERDMIDSIRGIIDSLQKVQATESEAAEEHDEEIDTATIRLVRILSILTVFLETATNQLSSNPAVTEFAQLIVPSVTHTDSFVREAAVGCFGKLGLFTDETTIVSEFKPILLQVASCEDEELGVRGQAVLALSDWSMLFSECLTPSLVDGEELSFSKAVRTMMDDASAAAVCISAEVAAKLLFAGRVCDSEWFAKLLTIFFDPRMEDMMEDNDDVTEVGSPVRLQQLLTLFFPAICMKSDGAGRDAMMGSILPLLETVYSKPQKTSGKGKKSKKVTWPVAKMIQYICSAIDNGKPTSDDEDTVVQGQNDKLTGEQEQGSNNVPEADDKVETDAVSLNSTSLLAGVQVAEFLAKSGLELTDTEARALCKFLSTVDFDVDDEDINNVSSLKRHMEDLGMMLTDATSLRYLASLNDLLADIEVNDDDEEEEEEEDETEDSDEEVDDDEGEEEENLGNDEDDNKANHSIELGDDLLASLEDCRISENEVIATDKENKSKARLTSNNRKISTGSNASRRSSRQRLSDVN